MLIRSMFVTLLAMKFAIAHGAEFVDEDVVARIKEEIMQRSNVGNTLAYLCDVYGPRLTGTSRYLDMVEWAAGQLRDWGIENVWTERYGDDLRGWEIENYSATMTSPSFAQLNAQPVCCSASTDGVVTGSPLLLDIYDIEALRASSGKLRGRILLLPQVSEESHGVSGAWPDDRLEQAAFRTVRALSDVYMHSNEWNLDDAMKYCVANAPHGELLDDSPHLWFKMATTLRGVGHQMLMVVGKIQFMKLMRDRAQQQGDDFYLQVFMDEFYGYGIIPFSLIRWEMTGATDEIEKLW